MLATLKAFFSENAVKLLGFALTALSVFATLFAARQSGRNAERVDNMKSQLKDVDRANEIERNNLKLSDADVDKRLHKWNRDK
jgi:hypothetical protein